MMKNYTLIFSILVLSSLTMFGNTLPDTVNSKKKKKGNDTCIISTKNEILKEIISYTEIKNYFEISTRRGNDIKIFENEYLDSSTDVSINFQKVLIVDNPSRYPDALSIDFSDIDCHNDSVQFSISSRVKGIEMIGGLRKNEGEWEIQIFSQKTI